MRSNGCASTIFELEMGLGFLSYILYGDSGFGDLDLQYQVD